MDDNYSLIGDDCQLFTGDPGTELIGDGDKTIAELTGTSGKGYCLITAKAASGSIFPSAAKIGDIFPSFGSEVPAAGDKFKVLDLTHIGDATGWNMAVSRSEVDVSKLKDEYKTYRLGKRDAQGTIRSIFTVGITDGENGMISKTMRSFHKAATGTCTIREIDNQPIYFLGFIRSTDIAGEKAEFVFAKIYLYNMTLGADTGAAQSYDTSFRLACDPTFHTVENPAA